MRPREGDREEKESAQGDLETDDGGCICLGFPRDVRWKRKTLIHTLPGQFPPKSWACGGGARAWRDRAAASAVPTHEGKTWTAGVAVGRLCPLVTFGPLCRPRPLGPWPPRPPTWRARSAPHAHSPRAAAPRPLATTNGTARRAVTYRPPPPSRPAPRGHLTCGGARRGGGAAGRGSNRGSPRASPSPPRARAERTLRRRRRDGRAALAPAAPRAAPCPPARFPPPPSFPPSRAPIPTCRPLPALSSSVSLSHLPASPRAQELGRRHAGTGRRLLRQPGERGGHGEQRDRKQSPQRLTQRETEKKLYEPAEEKVDRRHQEASRGLLCFLSIWPLLRSVFESGLDPQIRGHPLAWPSEASTTVPRGFRRSGTGVTCVPSRWGRLPWSSAPRENPSDATYAPPKDSELRTSRSSSIPHLNPKPLQ